ncbi:MAG: hypothetical protein JO069_08390, partial [Verrucomicrobia bacterium]|nr:hypothetical protein [Verrucomicrobiota bacterium]
MNFSGWLLWLFLLLLLEGATAGLAIRCWRQLLRVRHHTRRLAQEGKVGETA